MSQSSHGMRQLADMRTRMRCGRDGPMRIAFASGVHDLRLPRSLPAEVDASATDADTSCSQVGLPCANQGETCGTPSAANCGVTLVCSDHDPKKNLGGCPISSRQFKTGIEYLATSGFERLHEQTLGLKLATYQYTPNVDNPDPTHLGFIIEDNPRIPAVDSARHRVDLYGYVSMVVATMQVQEKEIAELRRELEKAHRSPSGCKARQK